MTREFSARRLGSTPANHRRARLVLRGVFVCGLAPSLTQAQLLDSVELDGRTIPVTTGAAAGYVPDSACRSCHASIAWTYEYVGMAKSFSKMHPQNIVEDFENNHFYHGPSRRHYEMSRRDGGVYQKQYELDAEGRPIHELEQRIDYVIGSGAHVRTYLYRTVGGELFQLPLSWYSQTRSWGMSPGYDKPSHFGMTRRVERECMFCHNAYPEVPVGSDRLDEPPWFPEMLPEGIGCQRCHGPGAEHVRTAATIGSSIRATRDTIVNPSRLPPRLRDDVCMQCHLQPMVDPPGFIRLLDRGIFSYRAGEPLSDYMLHLDYDEPVGNTERFEINHHPYRLFQSACYQRSDGRLGCLTCHDPHRKVPAAEAPAFYRGRCLSCHSRDACPTCRTSAAHEAEMATSITHDCVACHMPSRRPQDVIRVLMTDHRIQRNPPKDAFLAPLHEEEREVLKGPKPYRSDPALRPEARDLLLDLVTALHFAGPRLSSIESALAERQPPSTDGALYFVRLLTTASRHGDAVPVSARLAERVPDRSNVYRAWGDALWMEGDLEGAVAKFRRAVELSPASAHYRFLHGSVLLGTGRTLQAIGELEEAVRLRPHNTSARANLAEAYLSMGRTRDAAAQLRQGLAVTATDLEACMRLGELLLTLDDSAEAVRVLSHAQRGNPAHQGLSLTIACALVRHGDHAKALDAAASARRLGADDATCLVVTALAHLGLGDLDRARKDYSSARASFSRSSSASTIQQIMFDHAESAFAGVGADR